MWINANRNSIDSGQFHMFVQDSSGFMGEGACCQGSAMTVKPKELGLRRGICYRNPSEHFYSWGCTRCSH